jgi:hypothetical protein
MGSFRTNSVKENFRFTQEINGRQITRSFTNGGAKLKGYFVSNIILFLLISNSSPLANLFHF